MIVISDTNILSSFAAANSLTLLLQLFENTIICIPQSVYEELQHGLESERTYINTALQAIDSGKIQLLALSASEKRQSIPLPNQLNAGERDGIILAQAHQARFLSNDRRAVRYCKENNIKVSDLPDLLRLLWLRRIVSQDEIKSIIDRMASVEGLTLSKAALNLIFAPRSKTRRKKR